MAASVEVLCPTGHRQKVKTTPNMAILQILEEVCTKRGFSPPEQYELRHGRKTLDVTLTARFAGLPNHAKLELVKAEKARGESEVVVAIQVEDQRLQHTFPPSTTLWHVLNHFHTTPGGPCLTDVTPPSHPILTYMRQEVIGEFAMKETTLKVLGLTSGRAMLRYTTRAVDDTTLQAIRDKIEKEKERLMKLQQRAQSNMEVDNRLAESNSSATMHSAESNSSATMRSVASSESMDTGDRKEKQEAEKQDEAMETSEAKDEGESMEAVETPGSRAFSDGSLRQGMSESQRREASLSQLESLPGVEVVRPDDFNQLSNREQQKARQMAAQMFPGLFPQLPGNQGNPSNQGNQLGGSARPRQPRALNNPQPFADFKFPEETKGKELYTNELSDVRKEEYQPCERETCIYNLDDTTPSAAAENQDLPDDFFNVTISDVQRMYADLQNSIQGQDGAMLMTSSMRRAAQEDRIARHPHVVLRVQFPDRLTLQGTFRPRETVFALQKFVKEHLEEKSIPFYLYTTPPKRILKDKSQSLFEANLVPLAVVYFGSETKKDHYLSTAARAELGRREDADRTVYNHMHKDTESPPSSSGATKRPLKAAPGGGAGPSSSRSNTDQPKMPKWFKAGKK